MFGKNKKLMERCKILQDYAILIDRIRYFQENTADMETAVTKAVDECIKKDILADFLLEHKAEVIDMCLTEYNEAETMAMFRKEFREDGLAEGRIEGADILFEAVKLVRNGYNTIDKLKEKGIPENIAQKALALG